MKARRISSYGTCGLVGSRLRRGVVAADGEDLVALQVQMSVEGLDEHPLGLQGIEGPEADGGKEIEVHVMI